MAVTETEVVQGIGSDYEVKYGFSVPEDYFFKSGRGLSHELVDAISSHKDEPDWMRKFRHKSLDYFNARPLPDLGRQRRRDRLRQHLLLHPPDREAGQLLGGPARRHQGHLGQARHPRGGEEVPRRASAPSTSPRSSTTSSRRSSTNQGVLFLDMDSGLREHEDIVREYFGTIIPQNDNKFAALNSAVWSGGSFIYVPPGVKVELPLQAYFRINAENMGQFERTLIIVDEDAYVHYVEGCTAPIYSSDSLHSAVVEIVVKPGGRCRYTTIQNWSNNVYNLVTKRAVAYENATMEWVDGNLGSKLTMKYPAIWLMGEGAHGEVLSIAFAGDGPAPGRGRQVRPRRAEHDLGDHLEVDLEERRPRRLPRAARGGEGRDTARSRRSSATRSSSTRTRARTPTRTSGSTRTTSTSATRRPSRRSARSSSSTSCRRGLSEAEASAMIVSGFVEPITKELPLEYAVELNRLIQLQMEGSVGWVSVADRTARLRRRAVAGRRERTRLLRRDPRPHGRRARAASSSGPARRASGSGSPSGSAREFSPQRNGHLALHVEDVAEARTDARGEGRRVPRPTRSTRASATWRSSATRTGTT